MPRAPQTAGSPLKATLPEWFVRGRIACVRIVARGKKDEPWQVTHDPSDSRHVDARACRASWIVAVHEMNGMDMSVTWMAPIAALIIAQRLLPPKAASTCRSRSSASGYRSSSPRELFPD